MPLKPQIMKHNNIHTFCTIMTVKNESPQRIYVRELTEDYHTTQMAVNYFNENTE